MKTIYKLLPNGVTPPSILRQNILDLSDRAYFIEDSKNAQGTAVQNGQKIVTIPAAKGGVAMTLADANYVTKTESTTYTSRLKSLNFDNEAGPLYYVTPEINIPIESEVVFGGVALSLFPSESLINIFRLYFGLIFLNLQSSVRFRNEGESSLNVIIQGGGFEILKPFWYRMRCLANGRIQLYRNGIFLGEADSFLNQPDIDGNPRLIPWTRLGFNTDTNSSFWQGLFMIQKAGTYTDNEFSLLSSSINEFFKIGQRIPYPIAEVIKIQHTTTRVYVTYNFVDPTGGLEGLDGTDYATRIHWFGGGTGSNPDVTHKVRLTELDGIFDFMKADHADLIAAHPQLEAYIKVFNRDGLTVGCFSACIFEDVRPNQ